MSFEDREPSHTSPTPNGRYSNYFKVGHSAFEFVLDFGQFYTDGQEPHYHTRVITNPFYAKVLAKLLQDSIHQHELNFGEIPHDLANEPKF